MGASVAPKYQLENFYLRDGTEVYFSTFHLVGITVAFQVSMCGPELVIAASHEEVLESSPARGPEPNTMFVHHSWWQTSNLYKHAPYTGELSLDYANYLP